MKSKTANKQQDAAITRAIAGDEPNIGSARALSRRVKSDSAISPVLGNSRDSARPQPIRKAGKNCLSLDAELYDPSIDGLALSHALPVPDATLIRRLNLLEARKRCLRAGDPLTRLEYRALLHTKKGTPAYRLAKVLGCRPCEAKRALETAQLKVRNLQREGIERDRLIDYIPVPDSVRLTYRERSVRGQPYSLISLDQLFAEIMHQEKFIGLLCERDASSYEKRRAGFSTRIRRFTLSLTIEVTEAEVKLEEFKLAHLRDWRTKESIHDMAVDFVRRRTREEAEAGERARVHGLSDLDLNQEEKSWCDRRGVLLEALPAAIKKRDRLAKQISQPQSKAELKRIKDQKDEAEEEIDRIEREQGEISWRLTAIREEQGFRVCQTQLPHVFADLNSKDARAVRRSDIEHMRRQRDLIASNPAIARELPLLCGELDKAIRLLSWIDRVDETGRLRGI
jgi:hypothetical protein